MKSEPGPHDLGSAAAAHLDCRHQVEPGRAEMAERYGAETTVPDWATRLGQCGSRRVNMVVSGTKQRRRAPPKDSSRPFADTRPGIWNRDAGSTRSFQNAAYTACA
jgi:hypothetical protein